MNETICSHCGCVLEEGEGTLFHEEVYCEDCLQELTILCSHCGQRLYRHDNEGNRDTPLCGRCYSLYYVSCERCGLLILQEDAYYESDDDDSPYCYHCHMDNQTIHSYHYKPEPIFYGIGPAYFGVELEVDGAGEDFRNARRVLEEANTEEEDHVYCKHDGSLTDGFEIVTHPMSLDYHCNRMPWDNILSTLNSMGYKSHNTSTCGLHCHYSRDALGDTLEEQEDVIARILYFFEKHWNELLRFSRRTQDQIERWASRYGYQDVPKDILKKAKGGYGRYACVNITNPSTIEFRIFRGTLKLNTIIASLQLIDRICKVAISLSDEELKNMSWSGFVSSCTEPELVQYLKERRLYINEPVTAEAEV